MDMEIAVFLGRSKKFVNQQLTLLLKCEWRVESALFQMAICKKGAEGFRFPNFS